MACFLANNLSIAGYFPVQQQPYVSGLSIVAERSVLGHGWADQGLPGITACLEVLALVSCDRLLLGFNPPRCLLVRSCASHQSAGRESLLNTAATLSRSLARSASQIPLCRHILDERRGRWFSTPQCDRQAHTCFNVNACKSATALR